RPVLRAEREYRQVLDAERARRADGAAQGLDAAAMPLDARQPALRGPAPVAIHDDGHVSRRAEAVAQLRRRLRVGHIVLPCVAPCRIHRGVSLAARSPAAPQTLLILFSLCASA